MIIELFIPFKMTFDLIEIDQTPAYVFLICCDYADSFGVIHVKNKLCVIEINAWQSFISKLKKINNQHDISEIVTLCDIDNDFNLTLVHNINNTSDIKVAFNRNKYFRDMNEMFTLFSCTLCFPLERDELEHFLKVFISCTL